ncbi:MAG: YjjW family glycine radical enzyme activase [Vallitaleaceae bacterium]|nr:YjjW family glycine radical enzyme activase [Vallitaleaceae bacterium]
MIGKLIVNEIIPFSNVDGSGNRCAIFLQGCNISCVYCHNPETINHCNHCGACVAVCSTGALTYSDGKVIYDKNLCTGCNLCLEVCPISSSPKTKAYEVDELVKIIKGYQPFIRGITVSGGEPTLQKDALVDLFNKVKPLGLTCYVDTNGFFKPTELFELIEATDQFLFDVKTVGDSKSLCKVSQLSCLDTLQYLLEQGKIEEVRTVLIRDFMDGKETVQKVSQILKNFPEVSYKLMKVHKIGLKEEQKRTIHDFIPSDQEVLELVQLAKDHGLKKIHYVL